MMKQRLAQRKAEFELLNNPDVKYYVAMTCIHTRWGEPEDKINRIVIECDTEEQEEQVEKVAKKDPDLKDINLYIEKPKYHPAAYSVLEMHYNGLGREWTEGKYRTA